MGPDGNDRAKQEELQHDTDMLSDDAEMHAVPAPEIESAIHQADHDAGRRRHRCTCCAGSEHGQPQTTAASPQSHHHQSILIRRSTTCYSLPVVSPYLVTVVTGLILWSILGALGRAGMQALTSYSGAPIMFASVWFNFVGCFCMGFFWEDTRILFVVADSPHEPRSIDADARKRALPQYIALTTGFCGSLTSFSSFMRDMFVAMSGDLDASMRHQSHGQAFMSLLAVLIAGLSIPFSACYMGRHLACAHAWCLRNTKRWWACPLAFLDTVTPALASAAWVASICLAALTSSSWPGNRIAIMLSFAPLGCLLRYQLACLLQNRWAPLPQLGTLAANVLGTAVFAASWIAVHMSHTAAHNSRVDCLLLAAGIQDGFCGCLTTVSTFVIELSAAGASTGRGSRYMYGAVSVFLSFGVMVVIMGPVRWGSARYVGESIC